MTGKSERRCVDCEFFRQAIRGKALPTWHEAGPRGTSYVIAHSQCRRRAPECAKRDLSNDGRDIVSARWPEVNANDWCGEFSARSAISKADGGKT